MYLIVKARLSAKALFKGIFARFMTMRKKKISARAIDPYRPAAMLILGGIKSFVFARQASPRREFSARLAVQIQSFLFSSDSTWPPCDKVLLKSKKKIGGNHEFFRDN